MVDILIVFLFFSNLPHCCRKTKKSTEKRNNNNSNNNNNNLQRPKNIFFAPKFRSIFLHLDKMVGRREKRREMLNLLEKDKKKFFFCKRQIHQKHSMKKFRELSNNQKLILIVVQRIKCLERLLLIEF